MICLLNLLVICETNVCLNLYFCETLFMWDWNYDEFVNNFCVNLWLYAFVKFYAFDKLTLLQYRGRSLVWSHQTSRLNPSQITVHQTSQQYFSLTQPVSFSQSNGAIFVYLIMCPLMYCYVWIYLLNIPSNIQQTNKTLYFIFFTKGKTVILPLT